MRNKKTRILLIPALATAAFFSDCNKEKNEITPATTTTSTVVDSTYIDSIITSGCLYAGNNVVFYFHIHGSGTIGLKDAGWEFGDGATSTITANAYHAYSSPGSYRVKFHANGNTIEKTIDISEYTTTSPHTAKMAGTRRWVGSGRGMVNEMILLRSGDSVIADTLLKLEVTNGGIVKLPFTRNGITLALSGDNASARVLTFTTCGGGSPRLFYYYDADSLVYLNQWQYGKGYENFCIHTVK